MIHVHYNNCFRNSSQSEEFVRQFPGYSLSVQLAEFSYPQQLRETRDLLDHPKQQVNTVISVLR